MPPEASEIFSWFLKTTILTILSKLTIGCNCSWCTEFLHNNNCSNYGTKNMSAIVKISTDGWKFFYFTLVPELSIGEL